MASIQQDLDSFNSFVEQKIRAGADAGSIDDLYDQWREAHTSTEDAAAVAASLRDMQNGETGRNFDAFASEFARQNPLTKHSHDDR